MKCSVCEDKEATNESVKNPGTYYCNSCSNYVAIKLKTIKEIKPNEFDPFLKEKLFLRCCEQHDHIKLNKDTALAFNCGVSLILEKFKILRKEVFKQDHSYLMMICDDIVKSLNDVANGKVTNETN